MPRTKFIGFLLPLTDLEAIDALQFERDTDKSNVYRDAMHVGLTARLPLARAIVALGAVSPPVDGDEGLWVGASSPEENARARAILDLLALYGDLMLGQMFDESEEDAFVTERNRQTRRGVEVFERYALLIEMVRADVGLPRARSGSELCDDLAARINGAASLALHDVDTMPLLSENNL